MTRMTPMPAEARRDLFFARCHDRDRTAGVRPAATNCERVSQQQVAAMNNEMPQPARMKNDPKSFLPCPYNVCGSPAALTLTTAPSGAAAF